MGFRFCLDSKSYFQISPFLFRVAFGDPPSPRGKGSASQKQQFDKHLFDGGATGRMYPAPTASKGGAVGFGAPGGRALRDGRTRGCAPTGAVGGAVIIIRRDLIELV